MKKRNLSVALLVILAVFIAAAGYCEEKTAAEQKPGGVINTADMRYNKSPLNKLGRGLLNSFTFFNEVPAGIFSVSAEKDQIAGWTLGLTEGFFTSFLRLFTGLFDTVTFIIPPYNKPLMTPEYSWESLEQGYRAYDKASSSVPDITPH